MVFKAMSFEATKLAMCFASPPVPSPEECSLSWAQWRWRRLHWCLSTMGCPKNKVSRSRRDAVFETVTHLKRETWGDIYNYISKIQNWFCNTSFYLNFLLLASLSLSLSLGLTSTRISAVTYLSCLVLVLVKYFSLNFRQIHIWKTKYRLVGTSYGGSKD